MTGASSVPPRWTWLIGLVMLLPCASCDRSLEGTSSGGADSTQPAFASRRHADTIETDGPYPVSVHRLSGEEIVSARVVYTLVTADGSQPPQEEVALRPDEESRSWSGELPGQSAGCTVQYYFRLTGRSGTAWRHPARSPARYEFRVVSLTAGTVAISGRDPAGANGGTVTVSVRAASAPSGVAIFRKLPRPDTTAPEIHVPLSVERANDHGTFVMTAPTPTIGPGELIDFYLEIRSEDGTRIALPADAPQRVFTLKRPVFFVESPVVPADFVLDARYLGGDRWVAFNGGGVRRYAIDGRSQHWSLLEGLPSNVARFVATDPVANRVYVGTDRGVVEIDPGGERCLGVVVPHVPAWGTTESSAGNHRNRALRAGPGAVSSLDGSVLFQVQAVQVLEQLHPDSVLWELRQGKLREFQMPQRGKRILGYSAMAFDDVEGCWLLGAFVEAAGQQGLQPSFVRLCAGEVELIPLVDSKVGTTEVSPSRVLALARDPASGAVAVAVEYLIKGRVPVAHGQGVFRLDEESGQVAALAPGLSALTHEVACLAADWTNRRLLIGTMGLGAWQVHDGVAERFGVEPDVPLAITAIDIDPSTGSVLLGTTSGALTLSEHGEQIWRSHREGESSIPADALPMQVDEGTGRVLLSSYSGGLVQLQRGEDGRWAMADHLRPGRELPAGLFGEAVYTATGGLAVIVHSQGLLTIEQDKMRMYGPGDGLHSAHLLRVLGHSSGALWLSYTPLPGPSRSSGALQLLESGAIRRTVDLSDRSVATIGRWVEVPERGSVFAASRAGVIEFHPDGTFNRMSRYPASSIDREPVTGTIGIAGATVERFDGSRFRPLLFQLDHPRRPRGTYAAGTPIDLAIDSSGVWALLYPNGVLAVLDAEGRLMGLLDHEDGIPFTARRLLAHGKTGDLLVGSTREGLVVVRIRGE